MRWLRHNCKFESNFFLSLLSDPLLSLLSVIPLFSPFLSLLISFLPMLPLFLRFPPSPLFHIKLFFIEAHAAWNSIPPGTAGWNTRLFWAPAKQMLVLGVPPEISLHASLIFFFSLCLILSLTFMHLVFSSWIMLLVLTLPCSRCLILRPFCEGQHLSVLICVVRAIRRLASKVSSDVHYKLFVRCPQLCVSSGGETMW